MKFVIAGNYDEFRHYYPKRDRNIVYLTEIHQLYGYENFELEKVGTWYTKDSEFVERAEQELKFRKRMGGGE